MRNAFACTIALAAALLAGCASTATEPVRVKVLAINDFHGNLKPPPGGIRVKDPADASKTVTVAAGGAEHLATAVAQLRAQNPNHIFVAAGDLIGATPLLSALFRDEPTVEALNMMGLEASAVGNHEFDKGAAELQRLQAGGCHAQDGCKGPRTFKGAQYKYLAASTVDVASGQTLFPAYHVKRFQGIPVAFIGLTLKGTPHIVVPAGVAGLRFDDEAQSVNRVVPELRRQGIEAIVVLIHEGSYQTGDFNECVGISGALVDIVGKLDKAVDVVISGHTHRAYNCRIDGRLVTSAHQYGTTVTDIDIVLDPKTRDITSAVANNVVVRSASFAKEPRLTALIDQYEKLVQPLARRVVGRFAAALPREANRAGESPLGQVIADGQLAATRAVANGDAQLAFMNPGGIRAGLALPPDGQLRYEELFAIQPFYNNLVTMTLSGAQILQLLEEQWANRNDGGRVLMISRGFSYSWDNQRPPGQRVLPGSAMLNGSPLDPRASYRVTVNSFLAGGGDSFPTLKEGRDSVTGVMDVDALEQYIKNNPALVPGALDRITRLN